jgi:transcriptional regulator with XRE-family HTH domain
MFKDILKKERKKAGLTQQQLAEKVCVAQPNVLAWEKGLKRPSIESLGALANVFGCSTDYLLGREDIE